MTTICPFPFGDFSLLSQLNSVGCAAVILWPVEDCPDFRVSQFQICHSCENREVAKVFFSKKVGLLLVLLKAWMSQKRVSQSGKTFFLI